MSSQDSSTGNNLFRTELDVIVVGAGFAGLYMLHRLRELGLSSRVLERGSGIGGTWFWNRYPGARCDVESMAYSYQFDSDLQQEWHWKERYATQPEILEYIEHVADRFDLRRDVQLDTTVAATIFDEQSGRWLIDTLEGGRFSAQFIVMATGCLSTTNHPEIGGLDDFRGNTYHTGEWPHDGVDFTGQTVAVLGTGSSAIQSIPIIAQQAEELYVLQRTPNYSIPAHNQEMDSDYEASIKADYDGFRERSAMAGFGIEMQGKLEQAAKDVDATARTQQFERLWAKGGLGFLGSYPDLILDAESNHHAAEFVRGKIRQIVDDPAVADLLAPDSTLGCKRLCVDTGYYETFNRPNVHLIDISETNVEQIAQEGPIVDGETLEVDSIVFATGFDAMTGALARIDIRGRSGLRLVDKWAEGPRTYLGLGTAGFPNLFTITGPQSPSVLTNMLPSIEQHVNWITDCISYLRKHDLKTIEATSEAEDAWVEHCNELAGETLLHSCNSWYLGANVPGKPRVFMPYLGFPPYVEKCDQVAANGYQGFALG